ncbi:MAG: hypothetical protein MUC88_15905 [Planctomycetes bacterium]|jgi:hypothetical protein|nr:hypothetical protein [Planctomycetota bacterium]
MKLVMAFVVGLVCSATVLLVAGQTSSGLGRYQIVAGSDIGEGRVLQLDTYTGHLYLRDWRGGQIWDLGTLGRPFAMGKPLTMPQDIPAAAPAPSPIPAGPAVR